MHITPIGLNKIMEIIENFCDIYIKSKHKRIIKYKTMSFIVQKLEEIYANFLSSHDLSSILRKSYISLLLDKYK